MDENDISDSELERMWDEAEQVEIDAAPTAPGWIRTTNTMPGTEVEFTLYRGLSGSGHTTENRPVMASD